MVKVTAQMNEDYMLDLMVRMAHHSTAIEGNTLTQGETKSILIDDYLPRAMNMRELYEVLNYKTFMPFLLKAVDDNREISIEFIKDIHRILCNNAIESVPGEFKVRQNMVVGADFTPVPPYMVRTKLEDWRLNLKFMLENAKNLREKVEAICRQHIEFEHIHPFPDGNGRVGRALMVYTCLQEGMAPIVISVKCKKEYISYLNTENITGFTDFAIELQREEQERKEAFEG